MTDKELKKLEIRYIDGDGPDFVVFIQKLRDDAQLVVLDEKFRWVVTEKDGTQYIARPGTSKNDYEQTNP